MWNRARSALLLIAASLAACRQAPAEETHFPKAHRDVASIVGDSFSTEDARDRLGEAEQVIRLSGLAPGMSVADIGAGDLPPDTYFVYRKHG